MTISIFNIRKMIGAPSSIHPERWALAFPQEDKKKRRQVKENAAKRATAGVQYGESREREQHVAWSEG
jgi:hypothetical protein